MLSVQSERSLASGVLPPREGVREHGVSSLGSANFEALWCPTLNEAKTVLPLPNSSTSGHERGARPLNCFSHQTNWLGPSGEKLVRRSSELSSKLG